MKFIFIFALFLSGKYTKLTSYFLLSYFLWEFLFSANAAVVEESERQMDTVMVPPNDDFEESVREEGHEAEEEVMKARKLYSKHFEMKTEHSFTLQLMS